MPIGVNNNTDSAPSDRAPRPSSGRNKVPSIFAREKNRSSKRRYYRRLILSHLFVFMISLVLAFFIGNLSLRNLRDMARSSIQTQASYLLSDLDRHINEIRYLTDSITANQAILDIMFDDYRYSNLTPIDILKVRTNLNIYTRPYLTDVALHLPGSQRMISNRFTSLQEDSYIQAYYSGSHDAAVVREGLDSVRYMGYGGLESPSQLVVFASVPRSISTRSIGTAMFVIDPSIFHTIFQFTDRYGASFTLYSDTDQPLISYGSSDQDIGFVLEESGTSALKVVFEMPNSYFRDQTRSLQLQLSILLIITTALGTLVSWFLSRRAYRPVGNLTMLALDKDSATDPSSADEFELIRHGLTRSRTREEVEKDVADSRFLHQLVTRPYRDSTFPVHPSDDHYSGILEGNGILLRINLVHNYSENLADLMSPEPVNLLHTIVSNILDELYTERFTCIYSQDRPGTFTILVAPNSGESTSTSIGSIGMSPSTSIEAMREDTKRVLNHFQSFTRSNLNLEFHVAYTMLAKVRLAAYEANNRLGEALLQANVDEDKLVFTPEDVPLESAPYNFSQELAENLCRASIQEDKPNHIEVFPRIYAQVFAGIRPHGKQLHHLKLDLTNLAATLLQHYESDSDLLYVLEEATTLKQIEGVFTALLEDLRRHYLETHNDKDQSKQIADLCEKVDLFILEHYSDPMLSLHSFEEPFSLSSSYLSSLYKGFRGYSINDRITETRINKSKEILLSTDLNVSEVAQACGYLYSTVFIRSFKRLEQTTPAAYRRLHQSKE